MEALGIELMLNFCQIWSLPDLHVFLGVVGVVVLARLVLLLVFHLPTQNVEFVEMVELELRA